jgi:hypothetical protein
MSTINVPYTINTIPFTLDDQTNSRIERETKRKEQCEERERKSLEKLALIKQQWEIDARHEFIALPSGSVVPYNIYLYLENQPDLLVDMRTEVQTIGDKIETTRYKI